MNTTTKMTMNTSRKKLPKAVQRTAADMQRAGALAHETQQSEKNLQRTRDANELSIVPPAPTDTDSRRRIARANAIVERYANFSAVGGVIPLPLLNVAAVTTLIVRMVKKLCSHYGLPYQHGRARALVVSVAAGSIPTTASAVTTTTLVYFLPGINLFGLAVSSVAASTCTRGVGRRFVEHFEAGGTLTEFPVIERR